MYPGQQRPLFIDKREPQLRVFLHPPRQDSFDDNPARLTTQLEPLWEDSKVYPVRTHSQNGGLGRPRQL